MGLSKPAPFIFPVPVLQQAVDVRTREDAKNPDLVALIDKAAGIMIPGGDQLRLPYWMAWISVHQYLRNG